MAFNLKRFTRVSLADNTGALTLQDATVVNGPALFTYESAADTIAQISAANYFNDEGSIYDLKVGDYIIANGTDGSNILIVATVDTTTSPKTITVVSFSTSGSVATANIQNNAVTFAKIQEISAVTLLGNPTGGTTEASEVTLGSGLAFSGTSLIVPATNLRYVAVPITASAFNGMYATPIQLVAAPGANTLLVLDKVQLLMTYNSAAYAAGGTIAAQYDSTANGAGVIASTTLANTAVQATVSTGWNFNAGVVAETFSTCVNKGLYLSNISGAFTTGDSPMVAHVWYKVIPTV
jgi:hypothetical protein